MRIRSREAQLRNRKPEVVLPVFPGSGSLLVGERLVRSLS